MTEVVTFDERLRAPLRWWALAALLGVSVWWVFVLAVPFSAAVLAGAVTGIVACSVVHRWGSARITVDGDTLLAGRARVGLTYCADVAPLDAEQARAQRGRLADARAFLLLRPYISTGVRVDLCDPSDPTPYWLLSSRRPGRLAAAVRAGSLQSSRDRTGNGGRSGTSEVGQLE